MKLAPLLAAVTLALATLSLGRPTIRDAPNGAVRTAPPTIPSVWQQNGAANSEATFTYTIHLKSPRSDQLDAKLLEIAQSGGDWLTLEQLKEYTAVDDSVKAAVVAAVTAHGVKAEHVTWSEQGDAATVKVRTPERR